MKASLFYSFAQHKNQLRRHAIRSHFCPPEETDPIISVQFSSDARPLQMSCNRRKRPPPKPGRKIFATRHGPQERNKVILLRLRTVQESANVCLSCPETDQSQSRPLSQGSCSNQSNQPTLPYDHSCSVSWFEIPTSFAIFTPPLLAQSTQTDPLGMALKCLHCCNAKSDLRYSSV